MSNAAAFAENMSNEGLRFDAKTTIGGMRLARVRLVAGIPCLAIEGGVVAEGVLASGSDPLHMVVQSSLDGDYPVDLDLPVLSMRVSAKVQVSDASAVVVVSTHRLEIVRTSLLDGPR